MWFKASQPSNVLFQPVTPEKNHGLALSGFFPHYLFKLSSWKSVAYINTQPDLQTPSTGYPVKVKDCSGRSTIPAKWTRSFTISSLKQEKSLSCIWWPFKEDSFPTLKEPGEPCNVPVPAFHETAHYRWGFYLEGSVSRAKQKLSF